MGVRELAIEAFGEQFRVVVEEIVPLTADDFKDYRKVLHNLRHLNLQAVSIVDKMYDIETTVCIKERSSRNLTRAELNAYRFIPLITVGQLAFWLNSVHGVDIFPLN